MTAQSHGLRGFETADIGAIEDFWVESWRATGLAIDFDARRAWLRAHLARLASEGVAIVVGLDAAGRPAGFVAIDPASGCVDQLCVAREEQGGGLARALLAEAKRRAPGRIELHVNADNARARRFYAREGFEVAGVGVNEMSGLPTLSLVWRGESG